MMVNNMKPNCNNFSSTRLSALSYLSDEQKAIALCTRSPLCSSSLTFFSRSLLSSLSSSRLFFPTLKTCSFLFCPETFVPCLIKPETHSASLCRLVLGSLKLLFNRMFCHTVTGRLLDFPSPSVTARATMILGCAVRPEG